MTNKSGHLSKKGNLSNLGRTLIDTLKKRLDMGIISKLYSLELLMVA